MPASIETQGPNSAQKRTLEDLERGLSLCMDKGGRLRHGPPDMGCYALKVYGQETIEALREVARITQKFGGYAVPVLLKVIADDYESSDGDGAVKQARVRWLRDLAAKFAKPKLANWLMEKQDA